jgi:predicted phosphodiesterase
VAGELDLHGEPEESWNPCYTAVVSSAHLPRPDMLLCAAGDTHGALDRFYDDLLAFEADLGGRFDQVLHVGDFGIWPEAARVDRATRDHDGPGDFPTWWAERRPAPRQTKFIKGNHEDFAWLDALETDEVLPGLRYLRNGQRAELAGGVVVAGVGGCYGPSNYERPANTLQGSARRHYTRDELDRFAGDARPDVLLLHDAPAEIEFVKRFPSGDERRYRSEGAGLGQLVERLRPAVCFFGHHHHRVDAEIGGVRCVGLNAVGRPGHLVAFTLEAGASPCPAGRTG